MSKFRCIAFVATLSLLAFVTLPASVAARGGGGHGGGGGAHFSGGGGHIGGGGAHVSGGVGGFRSGISGGSGFRSGMSGGSGFRSGFSGGSFRAGPGSFRSGYAFNSGLSRGGFSSRNARMIGSTGNVRSFSNFNSASRAFTSRNFSRSAGLTPRGSRQFATNSGRNLVTGSMARSGRASVLRNNAFASSHAFARAGFHGGLAGQNWRHDGWFWHHRHPVVAIGWFGGLFWPYAYWDFIDYTFWPYAYDVFWPYVYDDLYVGMFGPYAYEGPAYASLPQNGRHGRRARQRSATTAAIVCNAQAPALTNWPIQQITETVQPDQAQQSALNDLKDATASAVNTLQLACPEDLPSTPTGRLAAMHKRIGTMLLALSIVQPPLQKFYDLLNDEQKARFNVINSEAQAARSPRAANQLTDLSQACSIQAARPLNVPTERIAQALSPTDTQRVALNALNDATTKAADFLRANCPADQTLTPPARVAAMEKRLNTMLEAIKLVEPALETFYGSLTDEQKARFNQLGSSQS